MGFSEKIKAYFDAKGLNNREVSAIMEGYSESLISRYNNSDTISKAYIQKLKKHFPDIDWNHMLKDDEPHHSKEGIMDTVQETMEEYKKNNLILIEEIESKLAQLKTNLAR